MTFRRLPNRFRGQGDAIMFLKFFTHLPERMIHPKIRDHPLQRRGHTPATYPRRGGTAVRSLQSIRRCCASSVFFPIGRQPASCRLWSAAASSCPCAQPGSASCPRWGRVSVICRSASSARFKSSPLDSMMFKRDSSVPEVRDGGQDVGLSALACLTGRYSFNGNINRILDHASLPVTPSRAPKIVVWRAERQTC